MSVMPRPMSTRRSVSFALAAGLVAAALPGFVPVSAQPWKPAGAAELLMYEEDGCVYCRRWHAEVGPGYPNSSEGRRAPLVRIDIRGPKPAGIILDKPVRATPTFVLVENGREVGRITGYPGADFFWGLLGGLIGKLTPETAPLPDGEVRT
jgi:hypothetical protein